MSKNNSIVVTKILKKLLKDNLLIKHHVESYDFFIEDIKNFFNNRTQTLLEVMEEKKIIYYFKFDNATFLPPRVGEFSGITRELSTDHAIVRGLTYATDLMVEVTLYKQEQNEEPEVICKKETYKIASLPLMVGSKLDPTPLNTWDIGGYMIVKGSEKIILGLEEIGRNIILNDLDEDTEEPTVSIYSTRDGYKFLNTVKSGPKLVGDSRPVVSFQPVNVPVDVITLIKALGLSEEQIYQNVDVGEIGLIELGSYFEDAISKEEACEQIAQIFSPEQGIEYQQERFNYILDKYLLLHLGVNSNARKEKGEFLCKMLSNWIKLKNKEILPTFVDSYEFKRIKVIRDLLNEIFHVYFEKQMMVVKEALLKTTSKKNLKLIAILNPDVITNGINNALISGTWIGNKQDLVTVLDRSNFFAAVHSLRKIKSPLVKTQQHLKARIIDPTHRGRIDFLDTPHNINCGLVKGLAFGTLITKNIDIASIKEKILNTFNDEGTYLLKHEGETITHVTQLNEALAKLKLLRRNKELPTECNFELDKKCINLITDAGRVLRPLFVNANVSKMLEDSLEGSLDELITKGYIEFVDVAEEKGLKISESLDQILPGTTHTEISNNLMLGLNSVLIPFLNNNSAARAGLAQKLLKQAIAKYLPEDTLRPYTRIVGLHYAQQALVKTKAEELLSEWLNNKELGVNIVLAVSGFRGANMEDGFVIKREAAERGLFECFVKKTYTAMTSGDDENLNKFLIPGVETLERKSDLIYNKLSTDGLPNVNETIEQGDAVIGKLMLPTFVNKSLLDTPVYLDNSTFTVGLTDAKVDSVVIHRTPEDNYSANVILRYAYPLSKGDKLVSRYAQKGIIGKLISERNLPFSVNGIIPDLLISPHAYPSRLAFGQCLEMLGEKAVAVSGAHITTSFDAHDRMDVARVEKILESKGYRKDGKEYMIDPTDGVYIENPVTLAVSYFMRLHHLVMEKFHVRAKGPIQLLTHQPTEGKQRGGGLRMGEMERDALISHGASSVVRERYQIDNVDLAICSECNIVVSNSYNEVTRCHNCGQSSTIVDVAIPYAYKLLLEEQKALNFKINLYTDES